MRKGGGSRPSVGGGLPSPVLVTGAGGFIGSHLTELCVRRGLAVKAFVHYNSENRRGWLDSSPCGRQVEVLAGDVRDFDSVYRAMRGCRTVLHLAALIGIPYSYLSPLADIRTNVEGTYNILEAARLLGLEKVVVTSTSETYGTAQYVPIDESHPAVGQSPYAATKISADQLALSYHRSFDLPVYVVRPFNTYGPRQSARAFIPSVAVQILSGKRRLDLGNLSPTRDLTFVEDTVAGFLAVAAAPALQGEACNIGTGREIAMGDLARRIAALLEVEVELLRDDERVRPAASEVERLLAANDKLLAHTTWKPTFDLDVGLGKTIDWLRAHLARYQAEQYVV